MSCAREKKAGYRPEDNMLTLLGTDPVFRSSKQKNPGLPETVDPRILCREQGTHIAERVIGAFDVCEPVIPGVLKRSALFNSEESNYYACRIRIDKAEEELPEEIVDYAFQMLNSAANAERGVLQNLLASARRAVNSSSNKIEPLPETTKVYVELNLGAEICLRSESGTTYKQPSKPFRRPFLTLMIETIGDEKEMEGAVRAVECTAKHLAEMYEDPEVPFA